MSAVLNERTRDVTPTSTTISGPVDALRRRTLFVAPLLVLATEYVAFQSLSTVLGNRLGYFLAFAIYWLGWCLLFPAWVLGWRGIYAMFGPAQPRFGRPAWLGVAVLAAPLALGYGAAFRGALGQATPVIVVPSLLLPALNATGEEILWRRVDQRVFPSRPRSGL